jgi:hypothetical protein
VRFPSPPPSSNDQAKVDRMIDAGKTFGQVEDAIDQLPASDENKTVLWLRAWLRLAPPGLSPFAEPPVRVRLGRTV